jgi:hypothetical protein
MTKPADHEKKPKDPKDGFPEVHKEVNYIFGSPDSYEPKRKQKTHSLGGLGGQTRHPRVP